MPPTVADILPRLRAVCLDGATHPDYQLTIARATQYRRFATGKDLELEMIRFVAQETAEQYASRVAMWIRTVPAWWEQGRKPFYEVARLRGGTVTKRFDYPEDVEVTTADRLRLRLTAGVDTYFQRKPLENYLAEQLAKSHCMSDPNAWLLTEFLPFDYRSEVAQPYPVLVPCEAAVDFQRVAGVTSYFTARFASPLPDKARFVCYLATQAVDCWPVRYDGNTAISTMPEGAVAAGVFTENGEPTGKVVYEYCILTHKAGRVPASVVGYVVDEEGTGESFVSPLHPGVCFLLQMNKVGSENDVVMSQMSSPIRATYSRPCPGPGPDQWNNERRCNRGILTPDGTNCPICLGTGALAVPTTALQTLTLPYPEPGETLPVKPADMLYFHAPPTENPKFQSEYLDRAGKLFIQSIFGSYDGERTAGDQTATASRLNKQSELTALAPFADKFSDLYVNAASACAGYVDAGQPHVVYEFPPDLERTSLDDLFTQRKAALDAGADSNVLAGLDAEIARKQYANDPDGLRRNEVRRRFMTYLGQTDATVTANRALGGVSTENWLLRTSVDIIFGELEVERPEFYRLPYREQMSLVNAKLTKMIAALPQASSTASAFRAMSFGQTQSASAAPAVA